jgi:hypothetical protein
MGRYLVWPTHLNIYLNLFWLNSMNMPHGKFLLHRVSQSKTIQSWKLNALHYFKILLKIFLCIKSWDMWQHITRSHCSPKKLHLNCKQQYIYDYSKGEGVFCWLFLSSKIPCRLQLVLMQLVQGDYSYFHYKCRLWLKISRKD